MRKLKNEELSRLSVSEFKQKEKIPVSVILDDVRSLHNIGSVFRTSDAFLIKKIYLCGITAQPPHKDIRKTALGATETVEWEYCKDILKLTQHLQQQSIHVIAIEQAEQSVSLPDFQVWDNCEYAIVLGNEVMGVKQDVVSACNTVVELPQFGTKHSLNISVCAGIIIWHIAESFLCTPKNKMIQ